jgi:predicted RNA-binding protein
MSFFILIVSPIELYPSGYVPAREVLENRLNQRVWPFNEYTRNRKSIKEGDKFVFYLAGRLKKQEKQVFVGAATAASQVEKIQIAVPEEWYVDHPYYGIQLKEIIYFKESVPIRKIMADLSFIKSSNKWGAYIQGGCISISEEDYNLIINLGH